MNAADREGLKEQLRVMAAGKGDKLDLNSKNVWIIENLQDPTAFFRCLKEIIPQASTLYFEGCTIVKEVAEFYKKHRAPNALPIVRDIIYPIPETFHVSATIEFINDFLDLLGKHATVECFDHVKAYGSGTLIFAFHDAFDGSACLFSDHIPEGNIKAFALSLGVRYRLEPNTNKRSPAQFRQMLNLLENPHKLKANWPWWKKALFLWKK
jgi:hypothetical protein